MHIAEVTTSTIVNLWTSDHVSRILTVTIQPVVYAGFSSCKKTSGPMKLPEIHASGYPELTTQ